LFFGCVKLAAISEDMVKDGYQNIMNIDISAVVVEAMTAKYKDIPQLKCEIFFEF
jgi:RAT1-interacting protein